MCPLACLSLLDYILPYGSCSYLHIIKWIVNAAITSAALGQAKKRKSNSDICLSFYLLMSTGAHLVIHSFLVFSFYKA